jgi:hypothetical protein
MVHKAVRLHNSQFAHHQSQCSSHPIKGIIYNQTWLHGYATGMRAHSESQALPSDNRQTELKPCQSELPASMHLFC